MISTENRIAILKKVHLFNELSDEELLDLAGRFREAEYAAKEVILAQKGRGEDFYLIFKGRVQVVHRGEKGDQELGTLVENDYFGEVELVTKRRRTASVIAKTPVTVLVLSREEFEKLLKGDPELKTTVEVMVQSRILAQKHPFKWLRPGEVVYFLARKHQIVLYSMMVAPALVLLVAITLAVWSVLSGAVTPAALGGVLFVADLGWAVWQVIDWGNDYYVVTNQRAVWLEKIIGVHDSRKEAPLSTILSVGVETDLLGQALGYGDVVVKTFVSSIPFKDVPHPHQAARVIEEYWQRAKDLTTQLEKDAMKDAIRGRLGLPLSKPAASTEVHNPADRLKPGSFLKMFSSQRLRFRYESGGTVTYRKHWVVLFEQAGLPALFVLATAGLLVRRLIILAIDPVVSLIQRTETGYALDPSVITWLLFLILAALWMVYQVIDWSNDMFQVTPEQIVDLDRKPFGTDFKRQFAPLENILDTRSERRGLIGYFFNYGTVYINAGGTQIAFEDVADPDSVQSDIDNRRVARKDKVERAKTASERNRFAEWLAAYSENADEFMSASEDEEETG